MSAYDKLREKLHTHSVGAPDSPEILEILQILFTPEEAGLALHLSFTLKPLNDVVQKAALSLDKVTALCEQMADKGVVLSSQDKKAYMLLPLMPGSFEFPIAKRKQLKLDFNRLAELWNQYYDSAMGHEMHGSKTNTLRIIPVQKAIPFIQKVLPFEEITYCVDQATCISVMDCACRVTQKKCNNPIETCFFFDGSARFLIERKIARSITKEECLKILDETEKAGLVHIVSNVSGKIAVLCNCCSCCCIALASITKLKDAASHPASNFFASVNKENCTACGVCEDICPIEAITVDNIAVVDVHHCIGCGLCASVCNNGAVELHRRADIMELPATIRELSLKVAQEKGRLDAFLVNLK